MNWQSTFEGVNRERAYLADIGFMPIAVYRHYKESKKPNRKFLAIKLAEL